MIIYNKRVVLPMSKKILVVEDNDRNRRLLKILLQARGYEVMEASTGKEALEYLDNQKPDLILMDIQLPSMDGLALTKQIKSNEKTKDIPIVAVTAYAMKGDKERILESGCDAYVSKPINTQELPQLIAGILGNESLF
jgi:two-component system cell cycle response regulator DivK